MKELAKFSQPLGSDGGVAGGTLGLEQDFLVAQVYAKYPIAKVVEPATKAVDSLLTKLEQAIPGDWDKPMIEKVKAEYKAELLKYLQQA